MIKGLLKALYYCIPKISIIIKIPIPTLHLQYQLQSINGWRSGKWQWWVVAVVLCNKIPYNKIKGDAKPIRGGGKRVEKKKEVNQYQVSRKIQKEKRVVFDPRIRGERK